jgi:hypothetical protein
MGFADTGATTDHRFDLLPESWRAKRALLQHVGADLCESIVIKRFLEQRLVGNATPLYIRTKTQILGVGNNHCVGHGMRIGAIARPCIAGCPPSPAVSNDQCNALKTARQQELL